MLTLSICELAYKLAASTLRLQIGRKRLFELILRFDFKGTRANEHEA